jgi:hypothetical protein
MRKVGLRLIGWLTILLFTAQLLAAESSDAAVIVADSRKFTGWQARWANLYNESHFWFALVTVVVLPLTALLLGRFTGWLMAHLGINLRSRELAEH